MHTTHCRITKYLCSNLLFVYGATLTRPPERPEQHHFRPTQSDCYAGRYHTLPATFEITWWLRARSPDPINCWPEMQTIHYSKGTMHVWEWPDSEHTMSHILCPLLGVSPPYKLSWLLFEAGLYSAWNISHWTRLKASRNVLAGDYFTFSLKD